MTEYCVQSDEEPITSNAIEIGNAKIDKTDLDATTDEDDNENQPSKKVKKTTNRLYLELTKDNPEEKT